MNSNPIYLDYAATTPCDPRVLEVMIPFFSEQFGNAASRNHSFGWYANEAVELAREQVAALLNAESNEIVFTSGATEAANLAIKGVFENYQSKGSHIITSNIEHKAVLDTCHYLEKAGADITYLPVDQHGRISAQQVADAIRPDTILISVMYANNETGVLMPVAEIGQIAKERGVIFFTDATQAAGKVVVNVQNDAVDLLCLSAHKLYGPKGAGALFVRRKQPRVKLKPLIHGGGHEKGLRSGTLNVPAIVGFGKACAIAITEMNKEAERITEMRKKLEEALLVTEGAFLNGHRHHRLPNICNLMFRGVDAEALIMSINKKMAVSSGSACSSAAIQPSHVLNAMGLTEADIYSSIRFSLGRFTTPQQLEAAAGAVKEAVAATRALNAF